MAARDRRMKASEVFAATPAPVFGVKVPFAEAFPDFEHLRVEVTERIIGKPSRRISFDERSPRGYVDCSNSRCYNGGVNIGTRLEAMQRARETSCEFTAVCQGYEGSPKGKRKDGVCLHQFDVKINLVYRESPEVG